MRKLENLKEPLPKAIKNGEFVRGTSIAAWIINKKSLEITFTFFFRNISIQPI